MRLRAYVLCFLVTANWSPVDLQNYVWRSDRFMEYSRNLHTVLLQILRRQTEEAVAGYHLRLLHKHTFEFVPSNLRRGWLVIS